MDCGIGDEIGKDGSVEPQEPAKIEPRPWVVSRQKGQPGSTPPGRRRLQKLKKKSQRLSQRITEGIKDVSQNRSPRFKNQNTNSAEKSGMPLMRHYSNQEKPAEKPAEKPVRRRSDQTKLASQLTPSNHFSLERSDAKLASIGYNPNSVFSQPSISLNLKKLTSKIEIFRQTGVWDKKNKGSFAHKEYTCLNLNAPFHSRETLFKFSIFQKQQLIGVLKQELINHIKVLFNNYIDPSFREAQRQIKLDSRHHNQVRNFFIEMIEQLMTIHPLTKENKEELDTKTHCTQVACEQLQSLRSLLNKDKLIVVSEEKNYESILKCLKIFKHKLQKLSSAIKPLIDNMEQIEILLAAIEYHFDLYKNKIEAKIDRYEHLENIESFHRLMQPILNNLCPNLEEKFALQFDNESIFYDFFSVYEIIKFNPKFIVCELYLLSKLPKNLSPYVNNYIWINNKETMYYIKEKKEYYYIDEDTTGENIEVVAKRVEITNFKKIPKNHKKMSLSVEKLSELIISNGGHNAIGEIINNPSLIRHFKHLIANSFQNIEDYTIIPKDFKEEKYNNLYVHKKVIPGVIGWLNDLNLINQIFKLQNINEHAFNSVDLIKMLANILTKLEDMQTINRAEVNALVSLLAKDSLLEDSVLAKKARSTKLLPSKADTRDVTLFDILSDSDEIKIPELLPLILKIYLEKYKKQQEALIVEQANYISFCP